MDFLTDSGTSAMSDEQWAGIMRGDESYAGSRNFYHLEEAMRDIFGYRYIVPTHQGRGAEHIMARVLVRPGMVVANNLYFTTSRAHQELAGGIWADVSVLEAQDPQSRNPFKGNSDVAKLERLIREKGAKHIAFVRVEASVNMAGGQPFSMENLKAISGLCKQHDIFLLLDATRVVENAHFIREREKGYRGKSLKDVIKEICSYTDGCTMSSKKDHFVNIGGFCATNREDVFEKAKELVVVYEGLHTYGGMAGRDMEALAIGMRESAEREELVAHYVGQVQYLGEALLQKGIPIAEPIGAHAVFLDAKRFLPHLKQSEFPAQTLAAELYVEGGVRSMERGIVSGQHGNEPYDGLELVRLTLPRRVYETAHLQYVAEAVERVWKRREQITGLRMTYEPPSLRFFQAKFERI
ncbi:MAG: tryptophanase [bacterium]|nr:tryptophanase [bacterium]